MTSKSSTKDTFRQVCFNIVGRNLDPSKVTRLLGIMPDDMCKRGDTFGKKRKAKQGYWSLEGRPRNTRLETQLKNIMERIKHIEPQLKSVIRRKEVEQAYLTFAVEPSENVNVAGYCLKADLLNKFTSLGIDIAFSIHMTNWYK
jgi:hypothetical protein